MTLFYYREEDQFREKTNSMRLRELYEAKDLNGLFELALLLNHEACYANSKVRWAISEALETTMPVSDKHLEMANETIQMLVDKKLKMAEEGEESAA
jgi:vesicle coat complex subunit